MLELLLPLLLKVLPFLAGLLGVVAVYFGIKRKGVTEERQRQVNRRIEEIKKVQTKIDSAVSQDSVIDRKVAEDVQKIKSEPKPQVSGFKPGDKFKF